MPTDRTRSRWPGIILFGCAAIVYATIGIVSVVHYNFADPDGPSRVANAGYVLFSRDPHLGAIGFVWNPLPSLVEIPILLFARWIPELKTLGLAGCIQSSLFMAGAVVLMRRIALDRDLGAVWRWVAIVAFAANPMILVYGGNGMSEAAEIFCILWAVRYLIRWVEQRQVPDLCWAAIALGMGYLARYDVAFAVVGAAVLVGLITWFTPGRYRMSQTALNVLIAAFPAAAAFVILAAASWILTGDALAAITSQYGNSSQITTALIRGSGDLGERSSTVSVIAARLFGMQPLVGVVAAVTLALAVLRRSWQPVVPVVVCGSVLAFAAWGQLSGNTFGWFRFYILAIPMTLVSTMLWWQPTLTRPGLWAAPGWLAKAGALVLVASIGVGFPTVWHSMLTRGIGNQAAQYGINSIIDPKRVVPDQQWYRNLRKDDFIIADYLDRQHLPRGSVLMDTFAGWGIWLASDNPKQFVITSDYDFNDALAAPWDHGIRYILVSNPASNDAVDAVSRSYPSMWRDGAGIGKEVLAVIGPDGTQRWRLYEVVVTKQPG